MNPREFEILLQRVLEDRHDEADARRLAECLANEPGYVNEYVEQLQLHSMLQWHTGLGKPTAAQTTVSTSESSELPVTDKPTATSEPMPNLKAAVVDTLKRKRHQISSWHTILGVAASLLIVVGTFTGMRVLENRPLIMPPVPVQLAEVVGIDSVDWAPGQRTLAVGDAVNPGSLSFNSGLLKLKFTSGATVSFEGRCQLELLDPMHVDLRFGQAMVTVEPSARGFKIGTPDADVIDLGTRFGLRVTPQGPLDVVVFEGEVRVDPKIVEMYNYGTLLTQGEAVRFSEGRMSRIVSVGWCPGSDTWSISASDSVPGLIAAVSDNLGSSKDTSQRYVSNRYYNIVPCGLAEDVPAYVDRDYQWNGFETGIPDFLWGAEYVMTFNDNKSIDNYRMQVTLSEPGWLYIFFDDRCDLPEWLVTHFFDTGLDIGQDENHRAGDPDGYLDVGPNQSVDQTFSVWCQKVEQPGTVTLGDAFFTGNDFSMYGVAATPLELSPPDVN